MFQAFSAHRFIKIRYCFFLAYNFNLCTQKNIKITLLDTQFSNCNLGNIYSVSNFSNQRNNCQICSNLRRDDSFVKSSSLAGQGENHLIKSTKNKTFFQKTTKKILHADLIYFLIKSIAPDAQIASIPIMNQHGFCSKLDLLKGLRKVAPSNIDILCLCLKINDFDPENDITDKEILDHLSMIPFVVVAAGNDGGKTKNRYLFKENIFIIGAAEQTLNRQIQPCSFSTMHAKNIFYMLEKDIKVQNLMIQGTSVAAALFTGFLANILMHSLKKTSAIKMHKILKKTSKKMVYKNQRIYIIDPAKNTLKI